MARFGAVGTVIVMFGKGRIVRKVRSGKACRKNMGRWGRIGLSDLLGSAWGGPSDLHGSVRSVGPARREGDGRKNMGGIGEV